MWPANITRMRNNKRRREFLVEGLVTKRRCGSETREFPLAMAEAPASATSVRNEPVPSSDSKQRLLFPAFLVFLCSKTSPTLQL